jgi:hypothetical protein
MTDDHHAHNQSSSTPTQRFSSAGIISFEDQSANLWSMR